MIKVILFDCYGVMTSLYGVRDDAMVSFVRTLKSKYRLAMLSNVLNRAKLDSMFKEDELDELFELVIASGETGFEKPDPRIYELTLNRLGVKAEECLFIDDVQEFCNAAAVLGMQTIHCVDAAICISEIQSSIDRDKEKY